MKVNSEVLAVPVLNHEICRTIRNHGPRPRYFNLWDKSGHSYIETLRYFQDTKRFNQFSPLRYEGFPVAEKNE